MSKSKKREKLSLALRGGPTATELDVIRRRNLRGRHVDRRARGRKLACRKPVVNDW